MASSSGQSEDGGGTNTGTISKKYMAEGSEINRFTLKGVMDSGSLLSTRPETKRREARQMVRKIPFFDRFLSLIDLFLPSTY